MRNSIRLANIFVVCLLVISVVGIDIVLAQEKFAPAGSKQGPEIFVQLGHSGKVTSVAFSPDGRYVLSGSEGNTLTLWDIINGAQHPITNTPDGYVNFPVALVE